MTQWNLLVVDDEAINLSVIEECLDSPEYHLDFAASGEEAWDKLLQPQNNYDMVLLDRMMPGMSGMDVLQRMKDDARLRDVPVIMQTAAASAREVGEGIAAGVRYYLTKPYQPQALAGIVRAVLADVAEKRDLMARVAQQNLSFRALTQAAFEFSTPADAAGLASLLAPLCPQPEVAVVGLNELLLNAVEHGILGIGYAEKSTHVMNGTWAQELERRLQLPEYRDRRATLMVQNRGDAITFCIEDQGPGFDWDQYLKLSPERAFDPNGRGIAIARGLAFSRMEFLGRGNVVVATVRREAA